MLFSFSLNTLIYRPKRVVIAALDEAMIVFQSHIDSESIATTKDKASFHFHLKESMLPKPFGRLDTTIKILDFQNQHRTNMTIIVRYNIDTNNILHRLYSILILCSWLRKNVRFFVCDFKKKIEKWG